MSRREGAAGWEDAIGARTPARVLLYDSGELADLRELLAELGTEFAEMRDAESACPFAGMALVVSTADTVADAEARRRTEAPEALHIAVIERDAAVASGEFDANCDFLVRRPVHISVLRLLVQRALYQGPERRARERVAIGAAVTLRSGLRSWVATLVDLSLRSCRVQSSKSVVEGRQVTVRLPRRLAGGELLALKGRVVRVTENRLDAKLPHDVAVSFDSLAPAARRALRVVVEGHVLGPACLAPDTGVTRRAAIVESSGRMIDRRSSLRSSDAGPTAAAHFPGGGVVGRVLIGRDLSPEGMRVDRDASIAEGDEFGLSLHGGARAASIGVNAVVDRCDDSGSFLRFLDLAPTVASRIEELVDELVVSQRRRSGAGDRAPVVVSEVVRRSRAG